MKHLAYLLGVALLAGSFAHTAAAAPLGDLTESIAAGRTMLVGLNVNPAGAWFVGKNSTPTVAKATVDTNGLNIAGLNSGTTAIDVCAGISTNCMRVNLTVTGSVLGEATEPAHPVGSWVILDKTVFYVHSQGLIPIPTWKIFLSNGGKSSLIIPANDADLQLPLLPLMEMSDSRLK